MGRSGEGRLEVIGRKDGDDMKAGDDGGKMEEKDREG